MLPRGDVPVLPRYGVFPNQDHDETELNDGLWCVADMEAGEVRAYGLTREEAEGLAARWNDEE